VLDGITPEKRRQYFEKALADGWEDTAILFNEDKATGFISIGKCRDSDKDCSCGEIGGIYLLPEYRGTGIGSELMKWGLAELKKRNFTRVTLWVLEDNISARRFYEKIGFEYDGTVQEITLGKVLKECRYNMLFK
jgi:ribosomal protein S18 acetylase RimI-like enzyme